MERTVAAYSGVCPFCSVNDTDRGEFDHDREVMDVDGIPTFVFNEYTCQSGCGVSFRQCDYVDEEDKRISDLLQIERANKNG